MTVEDKTYETDENIGGGGDAFKVLVRVEQDLGNFQPDGRPSNSESSGGPTLPVHIHATASRDSTQIRPRGVMIAWVGSPPVGYEPEGRIFLVVFRRSRWQRYKVGDTGTFRGSSYMIASKVSEVWSS